MSPVKRGVHTVKHPPVSSFTRETPYAAGAKSASHAVQRTAR